MRYLLLDRITSLDPERARGVKCVSLSDDVFADHFPTMPVMPGALIVEAMAQLGGALLEAAIRAQGHELYAVLTEMGRAKFRRMVRPGDRIELEAETLHAGELGGRVKVSAAVDGQPVTECELTFALAPLREELAQKRREQLRIWLDAAGER